jgi:hypothetical protein
MKSDHRIFGHKDFGIFRFQCQLDFLAKKKSRIGHSVAHLDEVLEGQIRDGIRVHLAGLLELSKGVFPVAPRLVQQLQQHRAILEPAIDSLSKERNNCVRGIAEQKHLAGCVPGRTFDGNHCASRVRKKVLRQLGHERQSVGKA